MSELTQSVVTAITQDFSPKNEKIFIGMNPLIIDHEFHIREHPYNVVLKIAGHLIHNKIQSIIFCTSRRSVELLFQALQDHFRDDVLNESLILPYRSGYTQRARREKEAQIRSR